MYVQEQPLALTPAGQALEQPTATPQSLLRNPALLALPASTHNVLVPSPADAALPIGTSLPGWQAGDSAHQVPGPATQPQEAIVHVADGDAETAQRVSMGAEPLASIAKRRKLQHEAGEACRLLLSVADLG